MTDLLVIGGGAAGLMAAGAACARGLTVTVLEHNPKGPGQKLLITGKGRCNVTSDSDVREFLPYVRHNGRFLYSSLYAFPPSAAMELFESLGVPLKTLRNVTLTLLCDGKPLFTEQGEALFTHFGLSGPLVLSASTYIEDITKHRYICEFDLKPALDEKTLYDRLTRDFAEQGSHSAQGALAKLLPNSMRPVAVEKWGIDPATKAAQITREQKQALVDLCKHWQVPVSALGDKEHAVITAGGVDVREVDPKTMASKLCAGLYFAGEVLDVDARTGGYNLQIAWSTAVAAAKAL